MITTRRTWYCFIFLKETSGTQGKLQWYKSPVKEAAYPVPGTVHHDAGDREASVRTLSQHRRYFAYTWCPRPYCLVTGRSHPHSTFSTRTCLDRRWRGMTRKLQSQQNSSAQRITLESAKWKSNCLGVYWRRLRRKQETVKTFVLRLWSYAQDGKADTNVSRTKGMEWTRRDWAHGTWSGICSYRQKNPLKYVISMKVFFEWCWNPSQVLEITAQQASGLVCNDPVGWSFESRRDSRRE